MNRALVVMLALVLVGCRGDAPADARSEVARARLGNVDVVVLAAKPSLSHGTDTFVVEFRRDGQLVDVGTVRAAATMPMPGMAPMSGVVSVTPTNMKGRYTATSDLSMVGDWRLAIEWTGPEGSGSVPLAAAVQ